MKFGYLLLAGLLLVGVSGCQTGVSQSETEKVRKEFSQENYEKEMLKQGKGAELEREKQAAAERGQ